MKLSDQAMGAIMMALQKSLLDQSDIVPVLKEMNFVQMDNDELLVKNPPSFKKPGTGFKEAESEINISTYGKTAKANEP